MSGGDTTLDRLSLTLPDPLAGLKRRFRRPRRPSALFLLITTLALELLAFFVVDLITGHTESAVWAAVLFVCVWQFVRLEWRQPSVFGSERFIVRMLTVAACSLLWAILVAVTS